MRKTLGRLIRWMLGIELLFCSLGMAQTPVTIPVTGNLGTIIGSPQPYAGILINLINCPTPVSITGYMGIVATTYQLQANASGLINSSVWPNDLITCNGTTGASQYSEVAVVNGVPAGTVQCYQVVSTQGVWYLNGQQQPITCAQTPPNPMDGFFRNLTSTGFFQGNNGAMSGTFTVNGLLKALGGFQLGTNSQACGGSQFVTGLTVNLAPICASLPMGTGLVSFNGRTTPAAVPTNGDYSYGQISGTPVFGTTPAAPSGLQNVVFQQSGVNNSAYIPGTAVTPGTYAQANVTVQQDGRITAITAGASPAVDRYVTASGCNPGSSTDSGCSGSITISPAMSDTSYFPFLTINSINGSFLAISISGSLTTTSVPYTITCTFNCSSVVTPTIYLHAHHN